MDRYAKRQLMIWCDAARTLIIGSVPVAAVLGVLTLGQLYAAAVTSGVCTVFFDVTYQSYLPALVAKEDLVDGNGKLGATQSFAQVTGPGLGAALAGAVGAARAMAADSISYGVSVLSLLAIRVPEEPPPPGRPRRLRADIAEGLSFVLRHPILRKILACTGTANLFGGMAAAIEIIFLVRLLHVRPADTGLLIAAASLGGVAGGVLSGSSAGSSARPASSGSRCWSSAFRSCSSRSPSRAGGSRCPRSGTRRSRSAPRSTTWPRSVTDRRSARGGLVGVPLAAAADARP
jgi:hypothetical protein